MFKFCRSSNTIAFFCLLGAVLLSRPVHADSLLLVGDEWCPYNCAQENEQQGYLVDLLREIFAPAGITVEYRVVPWSRAIKMVEQGKADVLLGTTLENTPHLPMSQTIGEDNSCYFSAKNSPLTVPSIAQVQQLRIGAIQDYSYDGGGVLDTYLASQRQNDRVNISSGANALQNNFQKIIAKRVDLVVENCNVGDYSLQRYGLRNRIENIGDLAYYHGDTYIAFNPKDPRADSLLALVNKGIREKRRNGELKKILQRYGIRDWAAKP
jgi:polar amino acid transport system substrate-binding protein